MQTSILTASKIMNGPSIWYLNRQQEHIDTLGSEVSLAKCESFTEDQPNNPWGSEAKSLYLGLLAKQKDLNTELADLAGRAFELKSELTRLENWLTETARIIGEPIPSFDARTDGIAKTKYSSNTGSCGLSPKAMMLEEHKRLNLSLAALLSQTIELHQGLKRHELTALIFQPNLSKADFKRCRASIGTTLSAGSSAGLWKVRNQRYYPHA
jgi:hypothetical protein